VVAHTLHNVADVFGIEKADGQFHQFGKKIGNQGNTNAGIGVQANPTLNKSHTHLSDGQNQLCN